MYPTKTLVAVVDSVAGGEHSTHTSWVWSAASITVQTYQKDSHFAHLNKSKKGAVHFA